VGARQKLNKHHILGSLGLAGLLGLVMGSWAVFVIAGAVMVGVSICTGEIRGKDGRQRRTRR
jgi:hypothetical protein